MQVLIIDGKAAEVITFAEMRARNIAPTQVEGGWDWVGQREDGRGVVNLLGKVSRRCQELCEATGKNYIVTDAGESQTPRYDIIEAPQVGDAVSYAFNGDSYPDGHITKVSKSLKVITTDTGSTYYRKRESGCWKKKGGTWSMIAGHINKLNPEF